MCNICALTALQLSQLHLSTRRNGLPRACCRRAIGHALACCFSGMVSGWMALGFYLPAGSTTLVRARLLTQATGDTGASTAVRTVTDY